MASLLSSLLTQSKWLAQQRKQPSSTGHVVLALYQSGAIAEVLTAHGITEPRLLEMLAVYAGDEPTNTLALACERVERLGQASQAQLSQELQLLCVLLRDPRSSAARMIDAAGVLPATLERALVVSALGSAAVGVAHDRQRTTRTSSHAKQRARPSSARALARREGVRRGLHAPLAQQRLASETESRRARLRRGPGDVIEETSGTEQVAPPPSETHERVPLPARKLRAPSRLHAMPAEASREQPRAQPSTAKAPAFELTQERFPLLCALGRNLSLAARAGQIDPVLGRELEVEQVLEVLGRRRAKNPVLVGAPGVGKTAVVEAVATSLLAAGDPRAVIELPASALLSGTGVRGALSERISGLLREVAAAEGAVVLFIDELHSVLGADESGESIASALKAALARGELSCIGATTEHEHRRLVERDPALARRFTRIDVLEPARDIACAIARGVAPEYERHHRVRYGSDAIEAAVDLSVRFMPERRLPDKAIGLLDQAGARVRRRNGQRVDRAAVAEVVAEHCGVPLSRLLMRDGEVLLALEERLSARVIGQAHAVSAIADALRKGAAGFRGGRPLCTFLFLGPTGVGKTEMAKAIAEQMFPVSSITRIDMSELSESHGVARLLGAPPGYLGHEDGGQLTEPVRTRPYQLVLLDEVEKAHREVLLALLPLLDEGRLTDGRGRTVDFTNTVIVMTSNLGVEALTERRSVGFQESASGTGTRSEPKSARAALLASARRALPPELWNRIDEPLCFDALAREDLARIAELLVAQTAERIAVEHGVRLLLEPSAVDALVRVGYDPALGARPMRRAVSRLVEAKLARLTLAGEAGAGDTVVLRGVGDDVELELQPADAAE